MAPTQLSKPQSSRWKFLPAIATTSIGGLAVISITAMNWLTPPILLLRVDDESASAHGFATLRNTLCRNSTQLLKTDDTIIWIPFADHTALTKKLKIANGLSLLGQCQQTASTPRGIVPGTSLMNATQRTVQVIKNERKQGTRTAMAAIFTLQAAEPVAGEAPLNWQQLRQQFQTLSNDRGVAVIIGPTGQLQQNLETHLGDIPNVSICPVASAVACQEGAIATARRL